MKKLIALVAAVCSAAVVWADTPIPEGSAYYDVTVTFTDFPELNMFGDWPISMDLRLGECCDAYGYRVGKTEGTTSVTARMILNLAKGIARTKEDSYTSAQPYLRLLPNAINGKGAGAGTAEGVWVGTNAKLNFTGVETVEGFSKVVKNAFSGRKMSYGTALGGSGTESTFQDITFTYVEDVPAAEEGESKFNLSIWLQDSVRDAGFVSIWKVYLSYPKLPTLTLMHPTLSEDGCTITGPIKLDVLDYISKINSTEYQSQAGSPGQPVFSIYGRGEDGVMLRKVFYPKDDYRIITGSNTKINAVAEQTYESLMRRLQGMFVFRTDSYSRHQVVRMWLTPSDEPDPEADIPSGMALYDITLRFTEFPDLNDYGNWPAAFDFKLRQSFYGQRVSVDGNKKSITVRAAMDIAAMIAYSKTEDYMKARNQPSIDLLPWAYQLGNSTAAWGTSLQNYNFDGVRTIRDFEDVIFSPFLTKTMSVPTSKGGTGVSSELGEITFKLVKVPEPVPEGETKYDVSVTLNQPLSGLGFKTVSSIKLMYPNLFTLELKKPVENGSVYTSVLKLDLPQMAEKINSDEYQGTSTSQFKMYVSGTDAEGAVVTDKNIATSSLMKLPVITGNTVADFEKSLFNGSIAMRNGTGKTGCRFVGLTIAEHKNPGLMLLVR